MGIRNNIFDAIKALAIWLVVLGHCVQYLSGLEYWNDKLFQFIYSFHMPLFFMASGFFFASSMKLSVWEFLRKKGLALLLPCFIWAIVFSFMRFQSWSELAKDIFIPTHWPFWFLKGLFLVQLVVYVSVKIAERIGGGTRACSSIIISLVVYIMPYMGVARVMIPIFWIGYIMKMYYEQYIKYHRVIGVIALAVFVGLYYFWNADMMHYSASASVTLYHVILGRHGYTIMNLLQLVYRIVLGVAGSVAIISIMHELNHFNKYISIIGASTAGIYILQATMLEKILSKTFKSHVDLSMCPLYANYILLMVVSIILVVVLTVTYQYIRKNATLDLLLFGCGDKTKIKTKMPN